MGCEKSNGCDGKVSTGPGYASPADAINGPREKVLFVASPCADPERGADAVVVVDVDPESATFGQIVSKLALPNKGDEIHHSGWNACSSCFGCQNVQRSHLIFPCLNSSRIYVVNVLDHKNIKIDKIIEKEELFEFDVGFPHTSHCLANGKIMISTLGDSKGDNKCDFALVDNKTFKVVGTWNKDNAKETGNEETNLEKPQFNYDFWYQPRQNLMLSTEWGTPNKIIPGFDLADIAKGHYGNKIHVYDWKKSKHIQTLTLDGPEGWLPLEVRFKHEPTDRNAFVGTALGSALYHIYRDSEEGDEEDLKMKHRLAASIPSKHVSGWILPVMPALITDILISMDDNYLFLSCWLHGDIRMYDIRDPFDVKLVGQCFIGGLIHKETDVVVTKDQELDEQPDALYIHGKKVEGGPQMLQISLDGTRLYVTTSLYRSWDKMFHPNLLLKGSFLLQLNVDNDPLNVTKNRLSVNTEFGVDFGNLFGDGVPYLAHEMRYPGGDCTSDIWV